ncbi:group II intron reverse transcriptase/maturase [Priestia megaterium]|uniref:group II intron reverse transcriptase/maturase n=2 Tax=Bacillaceae TaxID=186817 RepID=UPI0021D67A6B|nr:group II intron reverse transcriptase/maturase [Priestia megaterium]MCU7739769.1 group II intron reverse transcriptase/maturase [Priestia megaterium]MCU7741263.1 group II intron reverse transcriptase/maturase [Priestia megaterium]MCU7746704.1 group II intron reverse transcriptase/maturase [Priestia megaterium]
MNKYRYSDYYNMTPIFDELYQKSSENKKFKKLMDVIQSDNNIKLAFRMIKSNTGSKTAGTDGLTIQNIKENNIDEYVQQVRNKLNNFSPDEVRRVHIPKENSKEKRPLGIPTMIDRLIQQSIKQVLEPICEAKFHPHSYGFRPNRSTNHALVRMSSLVNVGHFYHVVDIDIKGFFDNVSHNKLIKQMYSLGIHDRKLLSVIKSMLKAPIAGEGIPTKGTPQGGILSPLLSNIVLNELDWWISSQWETFKTKSNYSNDSNRYRAINKTKLKKIFIIRYADDFKIMCKTHKQAQNIYHAVKDWLKQRLGLDISPDKSKVINLKRNPSDFLGFEIRAVKKSGKYVAYSHVKSKAKVRIRKQLTEQVKKIQKKPSPENIKRLNAIILGLHVYYKSATHVWKDFGEIAYPVYRMMFNRLKKLSKYEKVQKKNTIFEKFYGKCDAKTWTISGISIFPIHYVHSQNIMCFSQDTCDYTNKGRQKSTKALKNQTDIKVIELAKNYVKERSIQYNDNRIARASMCSFKCELTGMELEVKDVHAHHKIPIKLGGTDEYDNLIIVHKDIHRLIHATSETVINKHINLIHNKQKLKKLNTLRAYCKLEAISMASEDNNKIA